MGWWFRRTLKVGCGSERRRGNPAQPEGKPSGRCVRMESHPTGRNPLAVAQWLNITTKGLQDVIKLSAKAVRGSPVVPEGSAQLAEAVLAASTEGLAPALVPVAVPQSATSRLMAPRKYEPFIRHRPAKLVAMHAATQVCPRCIRLLQLLRWMRRWRMFYHTDHSD